MYKLVFLDENTPPYFTGDVVYYVDDLREFQKEWFELERDEDRKERFLKCKTGEYQCDLPFDITDENYRMIQIAEDYRCLHERMIEYTDLDIEVLNGYESASSMHIKNMKVYYKFILFKGGVKKIAKFELKGIYQDSPYERLSKNELVNVRCYGNAVIKVKDNNHGPIDSNEPSDYDEVEMKSIAYKELVAYEVEDVDSYLVPEEMFSDEVRKKCDLQILLEDIVGEAG